MAKRNLSSVGCVEKNSRANVTRTDTNKIIQVHKHFLAFTVKNLFRTRTSTRSIKSGTLARTFVVCVVKYLGANRTVADTNKVIEGHRRFLAFTVENLFKISMFTRGINLATLVKSNENISHLKMELKELKMN